MINLKKISILLAIFFVIGCSVTAISANDVDDTITIEETNNNNNLEEAYVSTATNFTDLQKDIDNNTEITLNNTVTRQAGENDLSINKTITIDGNGYTIDANNTGRIFLIKNSDAILTLKNITLMNGNADKGGAIYAECDITIKCENDIRFLNNTATNGGGAISLYTSNINSYNLTIINKNGDITFENNSVPSNQYGMAIIAKNINITGNNINFINNNGYGYAICAIYNLDINSTSNVIFKNNNANYVGDCIKSSYGYINIFALNNIIFENNTSGASSTTAYMLSCAGNAQSLNITSINGCINFTNNSAYSIIQSYSNTTFNANWISFYNNNVRNSILNLYSFSTTALPVYITSSNSILFYNNTATDGIIYSHNVHITNAIFYGNNITGNLSKCISITNGNDSSFENCFWGLNYKNQTEIKNDKVIALVKSNSTIAPDYWVLLNLSTSDNVFIGINNTFNLKFNIHRNDTNITPYDDLNGSIIVKSEYNQGNCTQYPIAPGNFTVKPDTLGNNVLSIQNIYTGEEICNVSFNVIKMNSALEIFVNNSTYGDNVSINVNLTGINNTGLTGNVTVNINGKNYTVSVENGQGSTNISDLLKADTYDVNANWIGDETYYGSTANTTFTISKATPSLNITIENITYGENATVTVNLTTITPLNDTVTVIINNKSYNITIIDGVGNSSITDLASDNYTATAIYNGNENYTNKSSDNVSFIVNKTILNNVTVSVDESVAYGETTKVTVKCYPRTVSGNVSLYVDGELYNTTDLQVHVVGSGEYYFYQGYFYLSNLSVGNHTLYVVYNGNENYTSKSSDNVTLTVTEQSITLTLENLTKYYKDANKLIAILTNGSTPLVNQTITFVVNGNEYNRTTDENGTASMAINLNAGTYNATAKYNETYVSNATIIVISTINATDLIKVYHNASQFYATFLNSNGTALANTNVTFNINGVIYNKVTDENGTSQLNINLDAGNYVLTATNPFNGEEQGYNITVLSTIKSNDIVKFFRNGTQYSATFKDINGSILANTSVKFNINGVFYTRTTDSNGTATLNINLQPGNYTLTAINPITNETIGSNVLVKSVLVGEDMVKTKAENKSYEVKVLDGQGNPLANQTVKMNIHGVIYTKTTDEYGIARLAIRLDAGDYIITTAWNGTYTSNNIKVNP